MSTYIPTYLQYDARQGDGWPVGITPTTKVWIENRLENYLSTYSIRSLADCVDYIFNEEIHRELLPNDLKNKPLVDWRYAVVDRGLRIVAEQVWRRKR